MESLEKMKEDSWELEVGVKIENRKVWEIMEVSLQKEVLVAFFFGSEIRCCFIGNNGG